MITIQNLLSSQESSNTEVGHKAKRVEYVVESKNCDTHGIYDARQYWFMSVWTRCPTCGEEEAAEKTKQDAEKALALRNFQWNQRLVDAAIPQRFMSKTLATYVAKNDGQQRALEFANRYAETFDTAASSGRCAIFCGSPGTGKTHLSIGIAMHVMAKDKALYAVFTTVQRFMRQVKGTWSKNSVATENQIMEMYADADLLILDEVGVQFGSDTEKQILFDLFNSRYERCRPTIFISNLQAGELKKYLGERVYDRIKEDGGCVVPFAWESHRGAD
jgi:DNA replication protein DnaC